MNTAELEAQFEAKLHEYMDAVLEAFGELRDIWKTYLMAIKNADVSD